MGILGIPTSLSPEALAVTTNLRVVSISIAAYEYVATWPSLSLIVAHILPAIYLPSLGNIGCIGRPTKGGKNVNVNSRGPGLPSTRCIDWA
jgi:hypothetical protein